MDILIADKLSASSVSALEALGANVTVNADAKAEDLAGIIGDNSILIVRSTKVNADCINAASNLSLIIRAGAGVNNIDLACASSRGIHVANCPGKNADAVAELALGLLIAADRRIVNASVDLRNGKWRKKEYGKAAGLKDRKLGVIGLGSIGLGLAKRAQALGMDVCAWSRSLTPEKAEALGFTYCADHMAVANVADAVSVHIAVNDQTKGMLNADFFGALKDNAIFINTSRGEVVDSAALQDAINNKGLRVGTDVFAGEPSGGEADFDQTDLAALVTATPHIGASTDQASEAIADEVVNIVRALKETGQPINVVNLRTKSSATSTLVVRHYNHVGVLAFVLDELRGANLNIEEMENTIFDGSEAALCTLKIDGEPDSALIEKISSNKEMIQVALL